MKIKVNSEIIQKLNPCKDRLDNCHNHYASFNGDIAKFLSLTNITYSDKLWVTLRLIPLEMRVVFALDASFAAADADAYAAYAAYDADAAAYTANAANEQNRQIEALIYLIKGE